LEEEVLGEMQAVMGQVWADFLLVVVWAHDSKV
jgi:hypothetical protein